MSIDTQYVGGKIQLTFTFDAKDGGSDIEFANRVKSASQWAVRELLANPPNADLEHPDLARDRTGKRTAMKVIYNAFNAVLLCGAAHIDMAEAVKLSNGGK